LTAPVGAVCCKLRAILTLNCLVTINAVFTATVERYNVLAGELNGVEEFPSSGVMEQALHELLGQRLAD
jgi:hypothetical protein